MPRLRFTIRRMMIAVLVAALAAWWFVGRPAWFLRTASYHYEQYSAHTTFHDERHGSRTLLISNTTMIGEWHQLMAKRYRRAAEHPWKPLGPDPLLPKPGQILITDPLDEEFEGRFGTLEEQRQLHIRKR